MVVSAGQVKKVGVIGAGTMGHGIAQAYAQEGYPVTITDVAKSALTGVKDRIKSNLGTLAREGLIPEKEIENIMGRITVVDSLENAVRDADLVTEAVFEDLPTKTGIFHEMEKFCSPECLLASNTSSFPMTQISSQMEKPDRAIVTHWMNPPYLVPLVEVVPGEKTSEETYKTAHEILVKIKKVPVKVQKEILGFLINRIQSAMNREVYHLVEVGAASAEDIDRAVVTSLGFRLAFLGPLLVRDLAGLDVECKVADTILPVLDSSTQPNRLLKDMVDRGDYGTKTGKGFFSYTPESIAELIKERDRRFIHLLKELYSQP
ncbi:MAG: 3-hydroxyacyl-CoA dehydrogenase family protein [Dehalococcoidales bacterium]|nr:3-hydroxyacyl-CoA dehydrogenase family protein [Dehalococcoidales bacterium]